MTTTNEGGPTADVVSKDNRRGDYNVVCVFGY